MKKLLFVLVFASGLLLAIVSYERVFIERSIGPSAIVALAILAIAFLLFLATLLLYGTRFRRTIGNVWLVIGSVSVTYIAVDLIAGLILIQPLSPPLVPDEYRHHKLAPNSYF